MEEPKSLVYASWRSPDLQDCSLTVLLVQDDFMTDSKQLHNYFSSSLGWIL